MKPLYKQQTELSEAYIQKKLIEFLHEDNADSDLTTQFTLLNCTKQATAQIVAEEELVFAGATIIQNIFKEANIQSLISNGKPCKAGDVLATIVGDTQLLLSRERVLLNLLQRLSGIASLTNHYVEKINSQEIKILDTRKTTPGLRLFEKHAVTIGGGYNHRLDLYDGVMFKDNHLTITTNLNNSLKQLKKTHANKNVQIEVDTPEQLQALFSNMSIQADAVLLDNMLPEEVIKCSQFIRSKFPECFIEVSGGITLDNLLNYRDIDIDGISIGAITHQAVSKNIKLEFK